MPFEGLSRDDRSFFFFTSFVSSLLLSLPFIIPSSLHTLSPSFIKKKNYVDIRSGRARNRSRERKKINDEMSLNSFYSLTHSPLSFTFVHPFLFICTRLTKIHTLTHARTYSPAHLAQRRRPHGNQDRKAIQIRSKDRIWILWWYLFGKGHTDGRGGRDQVGERQDETSSTSLRIETVSRTFGRQGACT